MVFGWFGLYCAVLDIELLHGPTDILDYLFDCFRVSDDYMSGHRGDCGAQGLDMKVMHIGDVLCGGD